MTSGDTTPDGAPAADDGRAEVARSDARLRVLAEVSRAFATVARDYQGLIETIARRTADLVGDGCQVTLLAEDGETLFNAASAHRVPALEADYRSYLASVGLARRTSPSMSAQVVRSGEPVLVADIPPATVVARSEDALKPLVARLDVHSFVVVPIHAHTTVIGTLSVLRSRPDCSYTPDDLALLQDIADRAGLAIENARLYAGLERLVGQRTAELAALAESEQRLAFTLASIGDAVIATDAEGRVEQMNRVAEQLTGWRLQDARGRAVRDVVCLRSDDGTQAVESTAERVLREGSVVGHGPDVAVALVSRDGVVRPIADSGSPIRDDHGRIHGTVLVFRDLTAARKAEADRVRGAELAAENRRIQETSRLKNEFLANMSHELRTPLNSIIGFGELLHDGAVGELAPQQREFLGYIVASSQHLLTMINDILDLSKVEAGKLEFRPEVVVPRQLLEEVSTSVQALARQRGVRSTWRASEALTEVEVDPARTRQVLYNFLSNAIKFTPAGGTIEARMVEAGPDHFRIEVEDTGIGIAPEDLPRLFVEFQQLDAGTGKRHGGTGLGLALTRRLVEAQGGEVSVSSELGRGSVFRAVLPRRPGRYGSGSGGT